jgi:hypothetical protein
LGNGEGARTLYNERRRSRSLAELLGPQAHDHDTWDLFLGWPINDPYLESIRLECLRICQEAIRALIETILLEPDGDQLKVTLKGDLQEC